MTFSQLVSSELVGVVSTQCCSILVIPILGHMDGGYETEDTEWVSSTVQTPAFLDMYRAIQEGQTNDSGIFPSECDVSFHYIDMTSEFFNSQSPRGGHQPFR